MCDENGKIIDGDMIISAFAVDMKKKGKLVEILPSSPKLTNLGFHPAYEKRKDSSDIDRCGGQICA